MMYKPNNGIPEMDFEIKISFPLKINWNDIKRKAKRILKKCGITD